MVSPFAKKYVVYGKNVHKIRGFEFFFLLLQIECHLVKSWHISKTKVERYRRSMKYALVTGASRGIGKAIALRFAQKGYCVIINFLSNQDCAQRVLEEIEQNGGQAELLPFDASVPQEIDNALDKWEAEHPDVYISVLVNNAGIRRDNVDRKSVV